MAEFGYFTLPAGVTTLRLNGFLHYLHVPQGGTVSGSYSGGHSSCAYLWCGHQLPCHRWHHYTLLSCLYRQPTVPNTVLTVQQMYTCMMQMDCWVYGPVAITPWPVVCIHYWVCENIWSMSQAHKKEVVHAPEHALHLYMCMCVHEHAFIKHTYIWILKNSMRT